MSAAYIRDAGEIHLLASRPTSDTLPLGDSDVIDFDDPAWLARERGWCTAAARGDQRAFGSIYDAFSERLYAVIAEDVRSPAHAEDIYCETLRQAFEDTRASPPTGSEDANKRSCGWTSVAREAWCTSDSEA